MMKWILEIRDVRTEKSYGSYHMIEPCAKRVNELLNQGVEFYITTYYLCFRPTGEVTRTHEKTVLATEILKRVKG